MKTTKMYTWKLTFLFFTSTNSEQPPSQWCKIEISLTSGWFVCVRQAGQSISWDLHAVPKVFTEWSKEWTKNKEVNEEKCRYKFNVDERLQGRNYFWADNKAKVTQITTLYHRDEQKSISEYTTHRALRKTVEDHIKSHSCQPTTGIFTLYEHYTGSPKQKLWVKIPDQQFHMLRPDHLIHQQSCHGSESLRSYFPPFCYSM